MDTRWILVADGARARLFTYCGPNKPPELVNDGEFTHINVPSREIAQEKRGRVFHSADGSRSAMERPSDPHEYEKVRFAAELANILASRQGAFDRLILVAAPKMLGHLRQHLPDVVTKKVVGELNKDLTNVNSRELLLHLRDLVNNRSPLNVRGKL
jgi:protein required for attachment to host cells